MARKKPKSKLKLVGIVLICAIAVALSVMGVTLFKEYSYRFSAAILKDGNIKIYPDQTFSEIATQLESEGYIDSADRMTRFAIKHDQDTLKAGNYDLTKGASYRTLLTTIKTGRQTPIRLTFNNFRTVDRLIGAVGKRTLADSAALMKVMTDDDLLRKNGFNRATLISMFIPNTYEVYWTITPEQFFEKILAEYQKFWSDSRQAKARDLGFTPAQISIIASIVTEETLKTDEMTAVAGVYINRLRKGMKLQADPTVKFALKDFGIRRLLFRHLEADSPYNTYKYEGLPPGPICMASIAAIDATLNYESHDYLFFCAKSDFSGYHAFARNMTEHSRNAKEYQNELNKRGIK